MKNNQKGITLVALVITIIVLLILAGVTIAALSGDNGILTNASKSKQENALGEGKDLVAMAINEATNAYYSVSYLGETVTVGATSLTPATYGGSAHRLEIAKLYIDNISEPSSIVIQTYVKTSDSKTYVKIHTTDKNAQQVTAEINSDGGLGTWSPTGPYVTTDQT